MKIVQSPDDMVAYWAVRTIAGLSMIRSMFMWNLFNVGYFRTKLVIMFLIEEILCSTDFAIAT